MRLFYETPEDETLAYDCGMWERLEEVARIAMSGPRIASVTMTLTNDHAWRVSQNLGLPLVSFICPVPGCTETVACSEVKRWFEEW